MDIAALQADLEAERQLVHRRHPPHPRRDRGPHLYGVHSFTSIDDDDGKPSIQSTPLENGGSGPGSQNSPTPTEHPTPKTSFRRSGRSDSFSTFSPLSSSTALAMLNEKYEVFEGDEVGQGAYGVVLKGRNRMTGEWVAVKRISKSRVSARCLHELQGEVETLSLVANAWTIRLEDVFQDEDHLLIVMDYVPGGNLSDALKRVGNFSEIAVRRFACCFLRAIEQIHRKGIVHRDLKPANCLLAEDIFQEPPGRAQQPPVGIRQSGARAVSGEAVDRNARPQHHPLPIASSSSAHLAGQPPVAPPSYRLVDVKIADFGFAVMVGNDQCLTNFCGTTSYMAPEIIARNSNYGKSVDIWSIGVMLFVLLSGELPFQGNSGEDLANSICSGQFSMSGPEWSGVSAQAKDLIRKMLVVNPSRRITAKEALQHPWIRSATNAESAAELEYPYGLPRTLSAYFSRPRLFRHRLRGAVRAVLAAHRLVYLVKCRRIRDDGLCNSAIFRSFRFLVGAKYEPPTLTIAADRFCIDNPRAIRQLADMVEASRTVETFDVSGTGIDNVDTVQYIVKVSLNHPSLQHLDLHDNPIPPLAGRALVRLARQASRLTSINVNQTSLGQDVIDQIASDLRENERKRHVDASAQLQNFSFNGASAMHFGNSPLHSPVASGGLSNGSLSSLSLSLSMGIRSPTAGRGSSSVASRSLGLPHALSLPLAIELPGSPVFGSPSRLVNPAGGGSSPEAGSRFRAGADGRMASASVTPSAVSRNLMNSLVTPPVAAVGVGVGSDRPQIPSSVTPTPTSSGTSVRALPPLHSRRPGGGNASGSPSGTRLRRTRP